MIKCTMIKRIRIYYHFVSLIEVIVLFSLLQCSTRCVCGASSTTTIQDDNAEEDGLECDLYVARASNYNEDAISTGYLVDSSILPISFYAGKHYNNGTIIPVYDMGIHLQNLSLYSIDVIPDTLHSVLSLSNDLIGSEFLKDNVDHDDGGDAVGAGLISGLGFSGTWNPGIVNAKWDFQNFVKRYGTTTTLDYRYDPMALSISDYFHYQMTSIIDIPLGMEIFPFFSQSWLDSEQVVSDDATDIDGNEDPIPFKIQHDKATSIIKEFSNLLNKYSSEQFDIKDAQYYWDFIRHEVVSSSDPTVFKILPTDVTDLPIIADQSTVVHSNPSIRKMPGYLSNPQQATCSDNIVVKTSTIPGAGRGAFAKRAISKGSIVAPCPLVRLHSDILLIPTATSDNGDNDNDHLQLLMNYVFSNLKLNNKFVFYPYGNGVNYINHASSSEFQPNVKLIWSQKEYHNIDLLHDELDNDNNNNPFMHIMDLIAIRDISKGDEILLDYGTEFHEALTSYQERYRKEVSKLKQTLPPSASLLNEALQKKNNTNKNNNNDDPLLTSIASNLLPTVEEQKTTSPLPENVSLMCFIDDQVDGVKIDDNVRRDDEYIPNDIPFQKFSDIKRYQKNDDDDDLLRTRHPKLHKCDILARSQSKIGEDYLYLIRLYLGGSDVPEQKPYFLNVPSSVFLFVDITTKDLSLKLPPFRHSIGIPDDIFPKAWILQEREEDVNKGSSNVCDNDGTCS